MRGYKNPHCTSIDEFHEDLKKVNYIKRLLTRYHKKKILKERLILNHCVIFCNLFGSVAPELLFLKLPKQYYPYIKTFLSYLNLMPESLQVQHKLVLNSKIPFDNTIREKLEAL